MRVRPNESGIVDEMWLSLDAQGVAVGIFKSREWCEEDRKIYGDETWTVTGPWRLAALSESKAGT